MASDISPRTRVPVQPGTISEGASDREFPIMSINAMISTTNRMAQINPLPPTVVNMLKAVEDMLDASQDNWEVLVAEHAVHEAVFVQCHRSSQPGFNREMWMSYVTRLADIHCSIGKGTLVACATLLRMCHGWLTASLKFKAVSQSYIAVPDAVTKGIVKASHRYKLMQQHIKSYQVPDLVPMMKNKDTIFLNHKRRLQRMQQQPQMQVDCGFTRTSVQPSRTPPQTPSKGIIDNGQNADMRRFVTITPPHSRRGSNETYPSKRLRLADTEANESLSKINNRSGPIMGRTFIKPAPDPTTPTPAPCRVKKRSAPVTPSKDLFEQPLSYFQEQVREQHPDMLSNANDNDNTSVTDEINPKDTAFCEYRLNDNDPTLPRHYPILDIDNEIEALLPNDQPADKQTNTASNNADHNVNYSITNANDNANDNDNDTFDFSFENKYPIFGNDSTWSDLIDWSTSVTKDLTFRPELARDKTIKSTSKTESPVIASPSHGLNATDFVV